VLPILDEGGYLTMELKPDTPKETVEQLADLLNRVVAHLTYQGPVRPEWIDQPGAGVVRRRKERRAKKP
jgi:hypothetical protein